MIRTLSHIRWLLLAGLLAGLVALPAGDVRSQDKAAPALTEAEKQKQLELLQKQLAELQSKLEALKATPASTTVAAAPTGPEGTIPEDLLKPFAWRCIGPANMGGRVTALAVNESDPMMYWVGLGGGADKFY